MVSIIVNQMQRDRLLTGSDTAILRETVRLTSGVLKVDGEGNGRQLYGEVALHAAVPADSLQQAEAGAD